MKMGNGFGNSKAGIGAITVALSVVLLFGTIPVPATESASDLAGVCDWDNVISCLAEDELVGAIDDTGGDFSVECNGRINDVGGGGSDPHYGAAVAMGVGSVASMALGVIVVIVSTAPSAGGGSDAYVEWAWLCEQTSGNFWAEGSGGVDRSVIIQGVHPDTGDYTTISECSYRGGPLDSGCKVYWNDDSPTETLAADSGEGFIGNFQGPDVVDVCTKPELRAVNYPTSYDILPFWDSVKAQTTIKDPLVDIEYFDEFCKEDVEVEWEWGALDEVLLSLLELLEIQSDEEINYSEFVEMLAELLDSLGVIGMQDTFGDLYDSEEIYFDGSRSDLLELVKDYD